MKGARGPESTSGGTSTTLAVRVIPRSSREEVVGISGDVVRIRLTAPAVENRANDALVRFLSRMLDVPRRQIGIVSGGTARRKMVRVDGVAREDVFRRLGLT